MKKILAILLAVMMVCFLSFGVYAEEVPEEDVEQPPADDATEETPEETPDETPEGDETENTEEQIEAELTTDKIVNWFTSNLEEISVIVTMILTVYYQVRKHKVLNQSIGTMNNNAVTIAEDSTKAMGDISSVVGGYMEEMAKLLAEVRANEEEKHKLEATLAEVHAHLQTAKAANIEFANELAELLCLSNIPNSRKDELYARHRAAVETIAAAEKTEVKENDGEEA